MPTLPSSGKTFIDGEVNQRMTADQHNSLINHLYVIGLPEFQVGGRLRRLLVSVTACIIMHFSYTYKTYGDGNTYVNKMSTAAIRADIARNKTDAIMKLQFWSVIILTECREANSSEGCNNLIAQQSLIDQLMGCNNKFATLHSKLIESQAE